MQLTVNHNINTHFNQYIAGHFFYKILNISILKVPYRDIKVSRYRDTKVSRLQAFTILIINLLQNGCPAKVPAKTVLSIWLSTFYTYFFKKLAGHFIEFAIKRTSAWAFNYTKMQELGIVLEKNHSEPEKPASQQPATADDLPF